jgi:hypothetical protein
MKNIFILPMVISFAMICSCQKQDAVAEQQLAQRKVELDAREDALIEREKMADEREKSLDKREKALAEREKAMTNPRTIPSGIQGQTPDPEQAKAERDSRLQQLPDELRTLIPPRSQVTAGDPAKQARPAPRQLGPEDLQRQWQRNLDKAKMSGKAVFPAAEATSPTTSSALDATSPTASPALDATSPTASPAAESTLPTSSPTP